MILMSLMEYDKADSIPAADPAPVDPAPAVPQAPACKWLGSPDRDNNVPCFSIPRPAANLCCSARFADQPLSTTAADNILSASDGWTTHHAIRTSFKGAYSNIVFGPCLVNKDPCSWPVACFWPIKNMYYGPWCGLVHKRQPPKLSRDRWSR